MVLEPLQKKRIRQSLFAAKVMVGTADADPGSTTDVVNRRRIHPHLVEHIEGGRFQLRDTVRGAL
ncbi:MAG: hypothetical protein AAF605_04950 [Myxococcota bacterium]